jgi:cbb3-type cytochrome oxidase maturation protein
VSVIVLLIIFSLLIAVGFLVAFIWSIKNDQYDDVDTPAVRILFDNETEAKPIENHKEEL